MICKYTGEEFKIELLHKKLVFDFELLHCKSENQARNIDYETFLNSKKNIFKIFPFPFFTMKLNI